ncbi:hypothetical protein DAEQUDRAFT_754221 [Daedalea quercina L-15889]|uniref:Secreted protein n=1 Tax=Daedalea quercina L-15889 TaxID=1314783 RepID=A0A165TQ95_9APHY|nr:hypothetical protein DAEQUDRAFT_754221 [Daedalea quercina L-15889]
MSVFFFSFVFACAVCLFVSSIIHAGSRGRGKTSWACGCHSRVKRRKRGRVNWWFPSNAAREVASRCEGARVKCRKRGLHQRRPPSTAARRKSQSPEAGAASTEAIIKRHKEGCFNEAMVKRRNLAASNGDG